MKKAVHVHDGLWNKHRNKRQKRYSNKLNRRANRRACLNY